MAGIKRLLLIRKKDVRANLMEQFGFTKFIKQEPIPVMPLYTWNDTDGLSHYGYILEGLQLEDMQNLEEWEAKHTGATLIAFNMKGKPPKQVEETVEEVLFKVSAKINPLGHDKDIELARVNKKG